MQDNVMFEDKKHEHLKAKERREADIIATFNKHIKLQQSIRPGPYKILVESRVKRAKHKIGQKSRFKVAKYLCELGETEDLIV